MGGGLFLLIKPDNKKYWRLAYRFDGKQKTLALGVYPEVSLADARTKRDEARILLAKEVDPSENRKAAKSAQTSQDTDSFEIIAHEWFIKQSAAWVPSHADRIIRRKSWLVRTSGPVQQIQNQR